LFNCFLKRGGSRGGGGGSRGGGRGGGGGGAPAPINPAQLQPVPAAPNVKAMGMLPSPFYGDRTKAEQFIEEVKTYLRLNTDIPGFDSPMKKVVFVLTHMKGPNVAGWVHNNGEILDNLQLPQDNVPLLWMQFCIEFDQQFRDSSRFKRAQEELKHLTMCNNEIDLYIAKFKKLAQNANYNTGNEETVQIFMEGLNKETLQDILRVP
jgi:Retrotransposon gag protein